MRVRYVALTFILWPLAYFTINLPDVIARGWWALAPRPVLVAMIALMPPTPPPSYNPIRYPVWLDEAVHQYFDHEPLLWWPGESLLASWASHSVTGRKLERRKNVIAAIVARVCRDPVAAAPESDRVRVILHLTAQTYQRAATYEDHAIALREGMNGVNPVIAGASTRFRRKDRALCIETLDAPGLGPRYAYPVWIVGRGSSYVLWQYGMSMVFDQTPLSILSNSVSDTCPSAGIVSTLLNKYSSQILDVYRDVAYTDVVVEGHPCYEFEPFASQVLIVGARFAVDKQSMLIRRITVGPERELTVILHPRINHPIADDQLDELQHSLQPAATITRESIMNEFAEHIVDYAKPK